MHAALKRMSLMKLSLGIAKQTRFFSFFFSIVLFNLFATSCPAAAGSKSRPKSQACQALLSGQSLLIGDTPYRRQLAKLVENHPEVRVLVNWGMPSPSFIFWGDPITHKATPWFPFPGNPGGVIEVSVAEPTSPAMYTRVYSVVQVQLDESHSGYALKVNVSSEAFGDDDLEMINLYAALSAVPYASLLVIEQEINPKDEGLNQKEAEEAVQFISSWFKKGGSVDDALRGHEPQIVRLIRAQGEPFHDEHKDLMAFRTNHRGVMEMVDPQFADEYTVEYGFSLFTPEMENLFKGKPN